MNATLYIGPDGKLTRNPDRTVGAAGERGAARRLTEKLNALSQRNERSEYEKDVYEVLRDAELGRLDATRFCPVCRSEVVDVDTLNADEDAIISCEVCAYRGRLSTFNV